MNKLNLDIRVSARSSGVRGISRDLKSVAAASTRAYGNIETYSTRSASSLHKLNESIRMGKVGLGQFLDVAIHGEKYLKHYNRVANATVGVTQDIAGNMRIAVRAGENYASIQSTLGQRLHLTNMALGAAGTKLINFGKNTQWAGRQVMVGLTVPLGFAAVALDKLGVAFDKNLTKIIKVSDFTEGATFGSERFEAERMAIEQQVDGIVAAGARLGQTPEATTDAIAEFSQMGYQGRELDKLTDAALGFARVAGTDLPNAIEFTRIAAQGFGIELDDLTQTFANLNFVENNTALGMEELSKNLPTVAAVADQLSISIEETAGMLAMQKEAGIEASEGAVALRTGLLKLVQDATGPAKESFADLGISLDKLKELGGGDPLEMLTMLGQEIRKVDEIIDDDERKQRSAEFTAAISELFGVRQASRMLTVLRQLPDIHNEGTKAARTWSAVVEEGTDQAAEAMRAYDLEAKLIAESEAGRRDTLNAQMKEQMLELAEIATQVTNGFREIVIEILSWVNSLEESTKRTMLGIAGIAGVLGPATMALGIFANAAGQLVKFFSVATQPLTAAMAGTKSFNVQEMLEARVARGGRGVTTMDAWTTQGEMQSSRAAAGPALARISGMANPRKASMGSPVKSMAMKDIIDDIQNVMPTAAPGVFSEARRASGEGNVVAAVRGIGEEIQRADLDRGTKDALGKKLQELLSFGDAGEKLSDAGDNLNEASDKMVNKLDNIFAKLLRQEAGLGPGLDEDDMKAASRFDLAFDPATGQWGKKDKFRSPSWMRGVRAGDTSLRGRTMTAAEFAAESLPITGVDPDIAAASLAKRVKHQESLLNELAQKSKREFEEALKEGGDWFEGSQVQRMFGTKELPEEFFKSFDVDIDPTSSRVGRLRRRPEALEMDNLIRAAKKMSPTPASTGPTKLGRLAPTRMLGLTRLGESLNRKLNKSSTTFLQSVKTAGKDFADRTAKSADEMPKGFFKRMSQWFAKGKRGVAMGAAGLAEGGLRGMDAVSRGGGTKQRLMADSAAMGGVAAAARGGAWKTAAQGALGRMLPSAGGMAGAGIMLAASAALVPLINNWEDFKESFGSWMDGIRENIDGIVTPFVDAFNTIKAMLRDMSADSDSGLGNIASILGELAGSATWLITEIVEFISAVLGPALRGIIEVIVWLVQAIGELANVLQGDWRGFKDAIVEALKAVGRAILDILAVLVDRFADLIGYFHEGAGNALRRLADDLRNNEFLESDVVELPQILLETEENLKEAQELVNDGYDERIALQQELIKQKLIQKDATVEEIALNEALTEQQKMQMINLSVQSEHMAALAEVEGRIAMMSRNRAGYSEQEFAIKMAELQSDLSIINLEIQDMESHAADLIDRYSTGEELTDATTDNLGDQLDITAEQNDQLEEQNKKIEEANQRWRDWIGALKSASSEVMGDVAEAVKNAMEEQKEALEDKYDRMKEKEEEALERQLAAIDAQEEKDLERLDKKRAKEQKAEDERQRRFEAEKRRLDFLENREKSMSEYREAVARGNTDEAARVRIGMRYDQQRFILGEQEIERQQEPTAADKTADKMEKVKEDAENQRAAIEKAAEESLAAIERQREAAAEAMEHNHRMISNYLEEWQRVTPATEKEFKEHLGKLGTNLERFGISFGDVSDSYTDLFNRNIQDGFQETMRIAKKEIGEKRKWDKILEDGLLAAVEDAMDEAEDKFGEGGKDAANRFSHVRADRNRFNALRDARSHKPTIDKAEDMFEEGGLKSAEKLSVVFKDRIRERKPTLVGAFNPVLKNIRTDFAKNARRTAYNWIDKFVKKYDAEAEKSSGKRISGGKEWGVLKMKHTGGPVKNDSMSLPGMNRDESLYVLQHGEYVVQRDAVKNLGKDYLDNLNAMKKHTGGSIDLKGSVSGIPPGMAKVMGGYMEGHTERFMDAVNPSSEKGGINYGTGTLLQVASALGSVAGKFAAMLGGTSRSARMGEQTGWRTGGGDWPTAVWGKISPNTAGALGFIKKRWDLPNGVGVGLDRADPNSDHGWGKALDVMVARLGAFANNEQRVKGWNIADWFLKNAGVFGTKYAIWDGLINTGGGWTKYTRYGENPGATLGHFDHVHLSFKHDGGMVVPELLRGGKIKHNNTLANLHRGETVLKAPLTKALEEGLSNMNGGGNTYDIDIHAAPGMDERKLADMVISKIERRERLAGKGRRV